MQRRLESKWLRSSFQAIVLVLETTRLGLWGWAWTSARSVMISFPPRKARFHPSPPARVREGFPEATGRRAGGGAGCTAAPADPSLRHPGPGVGRRAGGPRSFQLVSRSPPSEQQAGKWCFAPLGAFLGFAAGARDIFGWRGEMWAGDGVRTPLPPRRPLSRSLGGAVTSRRRSEPGP